MYTLIYNAFFVLKREQKKYREKNENPSAWMQKTIDYIEWYFNILLKKIWMKLPSEKYGITKEKRKQKVIVSLTCFPKRIDTVWLTIESLFRQSVKADEIILWLADTQFPNGLKDLPESLTRLQERGLTIRFCDDLRSHKKYFYVMQEFPNDLIILVDDDMFYPLDTVKKLLVMHEKHPDNVCCISAQVISPSFSSNPSEWRNAYLNESFENAERIQVFTGSGSLFPPGAVSEKAFDVPVIREICPYADDLWLTVMIFLNRRRVSALTPWRPFPVTVYGTNQDSLYYINAEGGQNDIQWQKLLEKYKVDLKAYEREN